MVRRPGLLVVSMLLALMAAGCNGGDPEPEFSDETSLSPTSSPTPSESSSRSAKPLGPVETVRAWVKARNVTVQTGDTTDVYALSSRACKTCRDSVEPVAEVYENGGRYETYGWRVVNAVKDTEFQTNQTVVAGLKYAAGRTWPSDGADPVEYAVEKRIATFELVKEGDRWLVGAIVYVD